jgi:hypothetical protein
VRSAPSCASCPRSVVHVPRSAAASRCDSTS